MKLKTHVSALALASAAAVGATGAAQAWTLEEGAADQATGKTLLEDSLREAHLRARRSRHALAEHEQLGKDEVTAPMQSLDEELVKLDFFRA